MPSSAKKDRGNTDEEENFEMRRLINDCIDIRSIETLARLHIMIAQILETTSQESESHILTAAYCVQKIWQVSDICLCIYANYLSRILELASSKNPPS